MKKLRLLIIFSLFLALPCQSKAAGAITNVTYKANTNMAALDTNLMKSISATTPAEPAGSDLSVICPATRLSTARLPQSYTFDQTYYYFLSNTTNVGSKYKKGTLRLTRVKYNADGTYSESFMTLEGFGHGTNIDCVTRNGITYLWTSSDYANSISCFTFQEGQTLKKHAAVHYRLKKKGSSKKLTNIAPAIDPTGNYLAIRYTQNGKQCFQYYSIIDGKKINSKKVVKSVKLSCPKTTFQGFDIAGNEIYTVEGTRSASECQDIHEKYEPIRVRKYSIKTKKSTVRTISGASQLLHREPEGIKVDASGQIFLNITSHYKDLYTCVNVYQVH